MIDRTSLSIISLVLAGAGLLVVLTKFNLPEVNYTYFNSNPFAIKRDAIESYMNWIFTGLALLGLLVQIGAEVGGLPDRLHTTKFYLGVFGVTVIMAVLLTIVLTFVGRALARDTWLPQIIRGQTELFEKSKFIIENNGLREDQQRIDNEETKKEAQTRNLEAVERNLSQIEKLLEVKQKRTLKERIEALKPYFSDRASKPLSSPPTSRGKN